MSAIERVYTGEECRRLDRLAIDEFGISGIDLMNRAGRFALDQLQCHFPQARSIKVIAGSGNNAGDGYVLAGTAKTRGFQVALQQVGDPDRLVGDAKRAWQWMLDQDVEPIATTDCAADVFVDALLGTGTSGPPRPNYQQAIHGMLRGGGKILALDLPSGIDASTGKAMSEQPVVADLTCTFVGAKRGLFTGDGVDCAGNVELSELGIPKDVFNQVAGLELIDPEKSNYCLPKRKPSSHKNQLGHVLVVGGDLGSGGAAILAAEAALRTGAGLVTAATRPQHVSAFLARCPEVMVMGADSEKDIAGLVESADVVAVGPGLRESAWSQSMLAGVLSMGPGRLVVDAGALRLLKEHSLPPDSILTPHPGEAGHLLSMTSSQIQSNRPAAIERLTRELRCIGILKGAGSLIADKGELIALVRCSNPSLATAGSGDVLTGIVATALAQLDSSVDAAKTAVAVHCRAGNEAARSLADRSVVAGDLINNIRHLV